MRPAIPYVFLVTLFVLFSALQGCKKESGPGESVEDQQLAKLSKTWNATSVSLDGVDKTTEYTGFQLTISGTAGATTFNYSRSGATQLNPWPSSGTWTFGADPLTQVTRDDGVDITYAVSETSLQLTFSYNGEGYPAGRTSQVYGNWVFEFGL